MNTIKKLFALSLSVFALTMVSSCSEDEASYTPAKPSALENSEFYFSADNLEEHVIGLSDKEISATIVRTNTEGEYTLPLKVTNTSDDVFTVPTSVTFADGEAEAVVTVTVNDNIVPFETYRVTVALPEEVLNPYKMEYNYPVYDFIVTCDDYTTYAKGTYYSSWWDETFETTMEYSAILNKFRIKDFALCGYDMEFVWDSESGEITLNDYYLTGYEHPDYGMVYAYWYDKVYSAPGMTKFSPENNTFYFCFNWRVSAGSFGSAYDTFTMTEMY